MYGPAQWQKIVAVLVCVVGVGALGLVFQSTAEHTVSYVPAETADMASATSSAEESIAKGQSTHSSSSLQSIAPHENAQRRANVATVAESRAASSTAAPSSTVPASAPGSMQAERIVDAYASPALPFDQVNTIARGAVVNILCTPRGGMVHPITGSGVVIDPRGIILTNAHVAQYVLLSEDPHVNLTCVIRTGSPATAQWYAAVLYLPPVWVAEHANELNTTHPSGTGEHDYALLNIVGSVNGTPLPESFDAVDPDTREAVAFFHDDVLVASYPAEFAGLVVTQYTLHAASSVTTVQQLLTFDKNVDAISLGGIIEAQSGSSGGAVVNAWGKLVGLITTMTEGTTTSSRDLRAITLSYVDRDLKVQTGHGLRELLASDTDALLDTFSRNVAPGLIAKYADRIGRAH